jgi:hypothetical protein
MLAIAFSACLTTGSLVSLDVIIFLLSAAPLWTSLSDPLERSTMVSKEFAGESIAFSAFFSISFSWTVPLVRELFPDGELIIELVSFVEALSLQALLNRSTAESKTDSSTLAGFSLDSSAEMYFILNSLG